MGGFDDLAAQFDPVDNTRKGNQFEAVCKWYLENDPVYQPLLRRVWLWDDWPGRHGGDAGIDLVAEDHDGKLWAVQTKAYDPAYSISKRDIDKFVAESSRTIFTHRLLIGTTDKRHHIATRLMDDLGIPFIGLTQLRDADDYLDWPASPAALRPSKPPKPKKPHDYQKAAIADVVKGFKNADRGQLIMACGTGKTLTAWFITEKLAAERTLVLVPSLSLLKQTMLEWQIANPKKPFASLPVCSDETVGSLGEDAAVSHTSDIGVPVTTDPVVIAEFLRKRSGPRVVFSTYQSSPQIAKAFTLGRVPAFDLVIADEAHRVAGPVSSDFGAVLDPTAIKAKRRLFMTATPRYFTGRVLREAKDADYEVASMDDHTRFGEVFHRLSFGEAIERKRLTDYQVAIIGVDNATYLDWAERGTVVTLDGKELTDARSLAGQIGLAKAMKKFNLRRMISFHSRVKAARDFSTSMPSVLDWMPPRQRPTGTLWSKHASGEMSAGERGVLIQHLKRLDDGERGLLANARCLAEGVDVPALDGVAFIDPRRSEVDIVQAVGRAIRKADDKTIGTIVIPVFIDTEQDAETALDSSAFKPVWDVIKALRAHDTELGEQLDELRRQMGRKGGKTRLPGKIYVDVPATVGEDFVNAFEAHLVERTTAPWEYGFGLLEQYVAENEDALVPWNYSVRGFKLGGWVITQRQFYLTGRLSTERATRLLAFPGWSWNAKTDRWESSFQKLLDHVAGGGNGTPPYKFRMTDGFRLGEWVKSQRVQCAAGALDGDRIARLEAIPGWTWDTRADTWEKNFQILARHAAKRGDTAVPPKQRIEGVNLHAWAVTQRAKYAEGTLEDERARRLEQLQGWSWDVHNERWERRYAELLRYADEHGDVSSLPRVYVVHGDDLGTWVRHQRRFHSKGTLDPDRTLRLEQVPGWSWHRHNTKWEFGLETLRRHVESGGGTGLGRHETVDGFDLGGWAISQRQAYRKGTLQPDRVARLEAITGWTWDTRTDKWEDGFQHLTDYVDQFGEARVLGRYKSPDGFPLGTWVLTQRRFYTLGELAPDRARRLEKLTDWAWTVKPRRSKATK